MTAPSRGKSVTIKGCQLQFDLDTVEKWCAAWNTIKKVQASQVLQDINTEIFAHTLILQQIEKITFRYLGFNFLQDLAWNSHVDYMVRETSGMMGFFIT